MSKTTIKDAIYISIKNLMRKNDCVYVNLKDIYSEVASYLEKEQNYGLESSIRGRLQECCSQYKFFKGENLFKTREVKSGMWTIVKIGETMNKYIRYKNNKFLITNNDWIDFEECSILDNLYIEENNKDIIYEVKLTNEIGKEKANVIINELIFIRNLLKNYKDFKGSDEGYGKSFEVFAVSTLQNISYLECVSKYIVHGDKDGKIDAIFYNSKEVYVYQIKIGMINDDCFDTINYNYNLCKNNKIPQDGSDLYNFYKLHENELKNKNTNYKTVSSNSKQEYNYTPNEIYDLFFKIKLLPSYFNNLELYINKPITNNSGRRVYNVSTDGENNYIFFIKAYDLIESICNALGINYEKSENGNIDLSKYFYDNVRGMLSQKKDMIKTIKEEPHNFIKYNNGISINGKVENLNDQIKIINPVINNGQQTIYTLVKSNDDLTKVILPVKITNETDPIINVNISKYTNDQVNVKEIDMLSINKYIRNIQFKLLNNSEYFLKIHNSGTKEYESLMKCIYKDSKIISLMDFIKLYYSILNSDNLGNWKNSPNKMIDDFKIEEDFDFEISLKVCKATEMYKVYVNNLKDKKLKADLKTADIALKYILYKYNFNIEDAVKIIIDINNKYFYNLNDKKRKSKLIDIYKSNNIINIIKEKCDNITTN